MKHPNQMSGSSTQLVSLPPLLCDMFSSWLSRFVAAACFLLQKVSRQVRAEVLLSSHRPAVEEDRVWASEQYPEVEEVSLVPLPAQEALEPATLK